VNAINFIDLFDGYHRAIEFAFSTLIIDSYMACYLLQRDSTSQPSLSTPDYQKTPEHTLVL